ncbi:MAG: hypothetical protein M0Z67_03565 [Nitrospiraceae bacterium]|nr:hypothetical protein [Nitrospiraceae bacterium]
MGRVNPMVSGHTQLLYQEFCYDLLFGCFDVNKEDVSGPVLLGDGWD